MNNNLTSFNSIPDHLRGSEKGTFTERSVRVRLPNIGNRILEENDFPEDIVAKIMSLVDEVNNGSIRLLEENSLAPDIAEWNSQVKPYQGMAWVDVPWFFAETYFYRRVIEAVNYYSDSVWQGYDPYHYQKHCGLTGSDQEIIRMLGFLEEMQKDNLLPNEKLENFLIFDLWGNQSDLSLWPSDSDEVNPGNDIGQKEKIVVNDSQKVSEYLSNSDGGRIDIVLDNAGFELINDLLLANFIINEKLADEVVLHVKYHPTYVSDATEKDVLDTINYLKNHDDSRIVVFGESLNRLFESQNIIMKTHLFWTSSLSFWDAPESLISMLSGTKLLVFKGDANYRRSIGDRHWDYSTPYSEVLAYCPFPLLAIRVLKSELAIGIDRMKVERNNKANIEWMYNGEWGMIQFKP